MAVSVPFTTAQTTHGLLIQRATEIVGAITSWSSNQSRPTKALFEFGAGTTVGGGDDIEADSGEPFERIPNNIGGTTITINRYDTYTNRFETAFGTSKLEMLTRQDAAIRFIEFWASPDRTLDFRRIYYGAWFTSLGRNHNAEGDRVVMVNANAEYTRSREVTG